MPSSSSAQHKFMAAIAHSKSFAKKAGVPMSVGKDFVAADKGGKYDKGGYSRMTKKMKKQNWSSGKRLFAPTGLDTPCI